MGRKYIKTRDGIVGQEEQKMTAPKPPVPAKTDKQIISDALASSSNLKDAQNINGKLRIQLPSGIRIYDLVMQLNAETRKYVAFVYPSLSGAVAMFLIEAAYNRNLVGMGEILPNCLIVKDYKN